MKYARLLSFSLFALCAAPGKAAPDEAALGKAAGYPPARNLKQAYQEPYLVGSFSAMDRFNPSCSLPPSDKPVPLKTAANETLFRYRFADQALTLDD